jgi:hypothetical protein
MKYILILTANNGEKARLSYDTLGEAQSMKTAFMLMGQYCNAEIVPQAEEFGGNTVESIEELTEDPETETGEDLAQFYGPSAR